jgi:hypothetical protein
LFFFWFWSFFFMSQLTLANSNLPRVTPLATSAFFRRNMTARTNFNYLNTFRDYFAWFQHTGTNIKNFGTYRDQKVL